MSSSDKKFRLPGNVIALGLISLFTDISSEMLYPIIPFFLVEILKAQYWAVGIVEGAADGMSSLLRGLSGYLSDKLKRRKVFIVLGYTASGLAKPLTALAQSWGFVLGTRLIDRFGKSIRTAPRDALISDQVGPENRGYAFGFHRAMDTTGAVLGPIISLVLVWIFAVNYRSIFVLACIPAAIGVLIALVGVREIKRSSESKRSSSADDPPGKRWLNGHLVKLFIVLGIFALANSSNTFILLRAQEVFKTSVSTSKVGSIGHTTADALAILGYVLFNLSFAVTAAPFGAISDRIGRKKVIMAGYVVYAVVYFALAFYCNVYSIWMIFIVYGLFESLTHGVTKAMVSDLASSEFRGTALGAANTIEGIGTLTAGVLMGIVWQFVGVKTAFAMEGGLACLAIILLMTFKFKKVS
jgi:MFS family permease